MNDARYRLSVEVHQKIEVLYRRVEEHAAFYRPALPVDPRIPQPLGFPRRAADSDHIVCALAIKAATTKRAVFQLCEAGDGESALALTRVLLENACLLEWLTRDRVRLDAYAMFLSVIHERVVRLFNSHGARIDADHGGVPSEPVHAAIWSHTFQGTKSDRPTWILDGQSQRLRPASVADLFTDVTAIRDSFEKEVLYGALGSDVVHSGPYSILSVQRDLFKSETFVLRPMPLPELCVNALATSNMAMFLVMDSLTEYLGLDLSAELGPLRARWQENPEAKGDG